MAGRSLAEIKDEAVLFTKNVSEGFTNESGEEVSFSEAFKDKSRQAKDSFKDFRESEEVQEFTSNVKERTQKTGYSIKEWISDFLNIKLMKNTKEP